MTRFLGVLAAMVMLVVGLMAAPVMAVEGAVKETPEFKILVPKGWEFSDFGKGALQVYNKMGTFMFELKKQGENYTEKAVEGDMEAFIKTYKGTPVEKVTLKGMAFLKTTYESASKPFTMYMAFKDGKKVTISMMGPKHDSDPTMQDVLKSIECK